MMYVDEPWYEEAARNLLDRHALVLCEETGSGLECRPYPKAVGWPVLLAGVFAVTGPSDHAAFVTTIVLGAVCIPLVAVVTLLAGGRWSQALFAGLVLALHPLHAQWSATAETNAPACAVLLAGMAGALRYLSRPTWPSTLLAAGGLGFAGGMRPELSLAGAPVVAWVLAVRRGSVFQRDVLVLGTVVGALSVPLTWGLYEQNSGGSFLAIGHAAENIAAIVTDPAGGWLTLVILLLAGVGATHARRSSATVLGAAGGLVALVVLAYDPRIFYPRNFLGATVVLVPLAALALRGTALPIAAAAVVLVVIPGWSGITRVPEMQALETTLPEEIAAVPLPAKALVLAEWPTILRAAGDIPAMATGRVRGQLTRLVATHPLFLFCDMFCEMDFEGRPSACRHLLRKVGLEEVTAEQLHRRRYGLYRLQLRGAEHMPGDDMPGD